MERTIYSTIRKLYQLIGGFILGVCFILTGCINDLDDNLVPDAKSVFLSIKLPHPIAQNISTRAGATDFNTIKDLNVIIADGENIIARGYYYFTKNSVSTNPEVNWSASGETITIHFDNELTVKDDLTNKQFYIVANFGQINSNDVKKVTQLKNLKEVSSSTPGVPAGCAMFAQASPSGVHQHPDGTNGITMKAELKRTVAMVTVAVDGSGLNKNICLSNFSISLHNVPTECTIGVDNMPAETKFAVAGEYKEYQQLAWNPIVGTASKSDCGRETWKEYAQIVGGHYSNPDENPSDLSIDPLFQFENIHPANFGHRGVNAANNNQQFKRPASITSTKKEDIENGTKNCSYIKVRAHYEKIDEKGQSVMSGWVSFKLFLGADIYNDFDVKGNNYYKVTLVLTGNAVTEGGQINEKGELEANPNAVTWRVDTDLSTASFTTGDINLNAGGEFFYVDVAAGENTAWNITASGSYFIWVYGKSNNTGSAELWQSAAEGTIITPVPGSNGRLVMYAQPGLVNDYFPQGQNYREVVLTLTPTDGGNPTKLTIRQYKRCEITVNSTQYPYIKDVFGVDQMTLYVDRIDREARPWGFYGEELHVNNADGFDNTYYLFQEKPDEHPELSHREFAKRYLPFGTETRIDGNVIEDGGSAMIYAAMLYENQDLQSPSDVPADIMNRDFPTVDRSHDYTDTRYYWTIPSLEAWQIIEKEKAKLDPEFPILEWFQYWSSDAVTTHSPEGVGVPDGDSHSYAYQFGRGLDSMKEGDIYPRDLRINRKDRLRFRLISIKPDNMPITQ